MAAARIGRVKYKNVVPLRQGVDVQSAHRGDVVNHLANSYDSYTKAQGCEPDAAVVVFCGLKQSAEAYWIVRGDSSGGGSSILSLAAATITREIGS